MAPEGDKPAVVTPAPAKTAAEPKAGNGKAAAAGGADPVVVAPAAGALAASTGQAAAPKLVVMTEEERVGLANALAKAQATQQPKPVVPAGDAPAPAQAGGANPTVIAPAGSDAAAVAAAQGKPVVVDALSAPANLGTGATSVVVTDESARSSAEDFGTTISGAAAAAAAAAGKGPVITGEAGQPSGNQPVVISPGTGGSQPVVIDPGRGDGGETRRTEDDKGDMLAKLLAAGLGAYVVGQMIQNQGQVALNTGDRVVLTAPDGSQQVLKNDDALLLQPGAQVTTENFSDGSSRSIVTRGDGSRVVTIRDAQLRVLRRTLVAADGTTTELINDASEVAPVQVSELPPAARPLVVTPESNAADLRTALQQEAAVNRRFSLSQVRNISQVRSLVAPISIDSITFDTGSAAIQPTQAQQLASLGQTIADMVRANPREVFLIEGYTDTVGQPASNLALSDRRAESLALALSEYFRVPPENMVVQGYGESFLRVDQEGDVRANRRVAVRRITDLLQQ